MLRPWPVTRKRYLPAGSVWFGTMTGWLNVKYTSRVAGWSGLEATCAEAVPLKPHERAASVHAMKKFVRRIVDTPWLRVGTNMHAVSRTDAM